MKRVRRVRMVISLVTLFLLLLLLVKWVRLMLLVSLFRTVVGDTRVSIVREEVIIATGTLESTIVQVKAQMLTGIVGLAVSCRRRGQRERGRRKKSKCKRMKKNTSKV